MSKRPRKAVWWWEPRWSFVPRMRREACDVFRVRLTPRRWLRILIVSGLGYAGVLAGFRAAIPNLQFDWNWILWFPGAVFGIVVYIIVKMQLYLVIPPAVRIHEKHGIALSHGQSHRHIPKKRIEAAHLIVSNDRVDLWITTDECSIRRGVSPKSNLFDTARLLGDKLTVHDRRICTEKSIGHTAGQLPLTSRPTLD